MMKHREQKPKYFMEYQVGLMVIIILGDETAV